MSAYNMHICIFLHTTCVNMHISVPMTSVCICANACKSPKPKFLSFVVNKYLSSLQQMSFISVTKCALCVSLRPFIVGNDASRCFKIERHALTSKIYFVDTRTISWVKHSRHMLEC